MKVLNYNHLYRRLIVSPCGKATWQKRKISAVCVWKATRKDVAALIELNRAAYPLLAGGNIVFGGDASGQLSEGFPRK